MPGLHKGVSNQCTNQQILAKPRHQPSERDQQARDRLKHKAKLKSCAYIQLGEKALQTVHQTFEPDIPAILHLLALTNTTTDTDTVPTLFVIQEGINCMPTTDYFFTSIKPEPIIIIIINLFIIYIHVQNSCSLLTYTIIYINIYTIGYC